LAALSAASFKDQLRNAQEQVFMYARLLSWAAQYAIDELDADLAIGEDEHVFFWSGSVG
jgi:hypothetical protein